MNSILQFYDGIDNMTPEAIENNDINFDNIVEINTDDDSEDYLIIDEEIILDDIIDSSDNTI